MYHLCDGLNIDIYMEESQWHIIDNIGSGAAFNILILNFMNLPKIQIQKINYMFLLAIIIDTAVIKITAGIIQISNVSNANKVPPRLYPISVNVCVEVAPGRSWQKA